MPSEPRQFDFTKYRSREIVEKLTDVLSIGSSLAGVVRTASYFTVALVVAFLVICHYFADLAFIEYAFLSALMLMVGVSLGVPLGLLRVVDRSLLNIEGVLTILLDASKHAAMDFSEMRSGAVAIPSGREIVTGMYEQVLLPAIEEVVSGVFGVFRRPLLWMYRKTIGAAVGRMLIAAEVERQGVTDERPSLEDVDTEKLDQAAQGLSTAARPALKYIASARSVVTSVGNGLRSYALRPLYILFVCVLSVALIPIVAYIYLFGLPG